jgi:hypothetical protein
MTIAHVRLQVDNLKINGDFKKNSLPHKKPSVISKELYGW